ncbi:MAG: capsular exopolysaccharide family [Mucilaginibacter sp.]|nr:capsular exopolysaccharide family [Mucilaginibacter sp.]
MKLIRKPEKEENNSSSMQSYLFKLIPYWPMFLLLIIGGIIGAWFYLQYTTPLYETAGRVLIRDEKKGAEDSKAFAALDIISPKRTIDNEIEVFQSIDLMENVVSDLSLYAPVYQEKKFRDVIAYDSSPIVVSTNDLRTLKFGKKIYFSLQDSSVTINNSRYRLNKLVSTPYGNLIFRRNPRQTTVASAGDSFYFSLLSPKKVAGDLLSNLKVSSANKLSTIIDLDYKDPNPVRGEDVLNDLIKSYNLSIAEEKQGLAANTERFINERLTTVENNLLAIEHKQQSYQSNRGAIDISTQGKLYLENVSNNDQKVSQINMQLSVLKQIESYIKSSNLASGIVPSTIGLDDPGLTQMVKNIYELQLEVESLKKTTGENNPMVVSYMDKIEKIRPQILENLENERQSLLAGKSNLTTTNQGYSTQLQTMPETEKNLVDINRELNIESGIYTFLLQKKEETALSFISNEDGCKTIEKPQSTETPVSPKNKIIYLASGILMCLIGFGLVSARESLRNKIMYQKDIEDLTQLPVISEISAGTSKDPIVIGNRQRTLIAEQFRRLRTTLNYLGVGVGGDKKKVLVTSGISGEGKSFVALNLAISLSLTGKRVVILDFDLNKPSLHNKLNVSKGIGITDYLEGKVNPESIIQSTAVNENLFFASAGNLSDSPLELITNNKPQELLTYLDGMFDFIIIDAAPVGPVSDAYILSPLCDATLYIVRHAYTPKVFVERLDKNNTLNKLTNAAIVFNDVSSRSVGSYGYGYSYGYVYDSKGDKKSDKKRLN